MFFFPYTFYSLYVLIEENAGRNDEKKSNVRLKNLKKCVVGLGNVKAWV